MAKNKQDIINILKSNTNKFHDLGVDRIGLFGSFVRGEQKQTSDIDLLAEFRKGQKTYRNLLMVSELAERLLGRTVEVVTPQGLSRHIAPYIQKDIQYV